MQSQTIMSPPFSPSKCCTLDGLAFFDERYFKHLMPLMFDTLAY